MTSELAFLFYQKISDAAFFTDQSAVALTCTWYLCSQWSLTRLSLVLCIVLQPVLYPFTVSWNGGSSWLRLAFLEISVTFKRKREVNGMENRSSRWKLIPRSPVDVTGFTKFLSVPTHLFCRMQCFGREYPHSILALIFEYSLRGLNREIRFLIA